MLTYHSQCCINCGKHTSYTNVNKHNHNSDVCRVQLSEQSSKLYCISAILKLKLYQTISDKNNQGKPRTHIKAQKGTCPAWVLGTF